MTYTFRDLITGSNTSGKQFICPGEVGIIIDQIPADAPQDWTMGPKMVPCDWGAYRAHGFYPSGHGPYAFATGKRPQRLRRHADTLPEDFVIGRQRW